MVHQDTQCLIVNREYADSIQHAGRPVFQHYLAQVRSSLPEMRFSAMKLSRTPILPLSLGQTGRVGQFSKRQCIASGPLLHPIKHYLLPAESRCNFLQHCTDRLEVSGVG